MGHRAQGNARGLKSACWILLALHGFTFRLGRVNIRLAGPHPLRPRNCGRTRSSSSARLPTHHCGRQHCGNCPPSQATEWFARAGSTAGLGYPSWAALLRRYMPIVRGNSGYQPPRRRAARKCGTYPLNAPDEPASGVAGAWWMPATASPTHPRAQPCHLCSRFSSRCLSSAPR
jgi:hypothetical protein